MRTSKQYHDYLASKLKHEQQNKLLNYRTVTAGYTEETVKMFKESGYMRRWLEQVANKSPNTAKTYGSSMMAFPAFVLKRHPEHKTLDSFIDSIKSRPDPVEYAYEILNSFVNFLTIERKAAKNYIIATAILARVFLRKGCKIKVNKDDFKAEVDLPRKHHRQKTADEVLDRATIIDMLNMSTDIWFKACIMLLAQGPRLLEGCAIRNCDCNFLKLSSEEFEKEELVPTVFIRAQYSKMREDRIRPISKECARMLRAWYAVKYRKHKTSLLDKETGIIKYFFAEPEPHEEDLLLAHWHLTEPDEPIRPSGVQDNVQLKMQEFTDRMGFARRRIDNEKISRRNITSKSFRDFAKTTSEDYGNTGYSEWFIGHKGSTYYQQNRKTEEERNMLWSKVEPWLTFLDQKSLERKAKTLETQAIVTQSELLEVRKDMAEMKKAMEEMKKLRGGGGS